MHIYALTAAILLASVSAHAKSPAELFEFVSNSIVVVFGKNSQGKAQSLGSGVVLAAGEIVTNCHVIDKSVTLAVKHRSREYPATLKHADHDRDVCSLSVAGLDAPAAALGSTKPLKVGHKVFAVGAPKGLELTLSEGIISSLREVKGGRYLQISAPISPGSSGGGLFDAEGSLIGLPTFYMTDGQQLNFAVPVEWVKELPQRQAAAPKAGQSSVSWLNIAIQLEKKKDWQSLLRHSQAWTKEQPDEADAWFVFGIAYDEGDQTAKAIGAYQQALRINPEHANAWLNLGVAYRKFGQTAKAIEAYQQALRINPEDAAAWNNLGIAYGKSGQTAQAIEAHQQALRINPKDAETWFNLANVYDDIGQTIKAIDAYQQALRIDPEYASAWFNLGGTYGKSGQTVKAINAFQQTLRINPRNADAWFLLGAAYRIDGQSGKVTEVYRRLKILDPKQGDEFFRKYVLP